MCLLLTVLLTDQLWNVKGERASTLLCEARSSHLSTLILIQSSIIQDSRFKQAMLQGMVPLQQGTSAVDIYVLKAFSINIVSYTIHVLGLLRCKRLVYYAHT